jgi:hypothetical protein
MTERFTADYFYDRTFYQVQVRVAQLLVWHASCAVIAFLGSSKTHICAQLHAGGRSGGQP